MLKEVGASGQISLGKKYAGQLFDVVFASDGRVELVPMKAVPTVHTELSTGSPSVHGVAEQPTAYRVGDGWLTPERTAKAKRQPEPAQLWADQHTAEIDQYNAWASQREPYSQRVRRWRDSLPPQVSPQISAENEAGKP